MFLQSIREIQFYPREQGCPTVAVFVQEDPPRSKPMLMPSLLACTHPCRDEDMGRLDPEEKESSDDDDEKQPFLHSLIDEEDFDSLFAIATGKKPSMEPPTPTPTPKKKPMTRKKTKKGKKRSTKKRSIQRS
jgi:hypothetical protein